jgi:N-ethylmaleimide reductase
MSDSDSAKTLGYVAQELNRFGLAYLHVIEPRIRGYEDLELGVPAVASCSLRGIFNGPIVAAGGFTKERAEDLLRGRPSRLYGLRNA